MSTPYYSVYDGAEVDARLAAAEALGVVGKVALAQGIQEGTVTGLALAFTPTIILLSLQLPDDSNVEMFYACPVGEPTADGFSFFLSSETNLSSYVLHYHLAP